MVVQGRVAKNMERPNLIQDLGKRPLTREVLVALRTRALRRRAWYQVLDRMERGLVDLTILWVDKIRNNSMTKVLLRILKKLVQALEQKMVQVLMVGKRLAVNASRIAVRWGNSQAYVWRFDPGFWVALVNMTGGR